MTKLQTLLIQIEDTNILLRFSLFTFWLTSINFVERILIDFTQKSAVSAQIESLLKFP